MSPLPWILFVLIIGGGYRVDMHSEAMASEESCRKAAAIIASSPAARSVTVYSTCFPR